MRVLGREPVDALNDVVRDAQKDTVFAGLGLKSATGRNKPALSRFGRYVVLGTLGQGGMGTVLKGYDEELNRQVALKVLRSDLGERDQRRLKREAQALAKLAHPNVVQVFEVGEVDGQVFVAMELIKGMTLRDWQMQESRPGWKDCVRIYLQAGRGLAAAHAAGLVHRDFKPANCMVDEQGRVRVLDFGLVRGVGSTLDAASKGTILDPVPHADALPAVLTHAGQLGTPQYMSPEQIDRKLTDARSDIFSFCISLYEAVHGERPFQGPTIDALFDAITSGRIAPSSRRATAPKKLNRALLRGLSVEAVDRWSSMEKLLAELHELVAPRAGRGMGLGLTFGLSIVGAGVVAGSYIEIMDRCTGSEMHIETIWGAERQNKVEMAILGTGLAYAPQSWVLAKSKLDDFSSSWIKAHRNACEATNVRKEQSSQIMDLKMECLRGAKLELETVISELSQADASVTENICRIVDSLPRLERCNDIDALKAGSEPPPAEELESSERILALLREARVAMNAGHYARAKEKIEKAASQTSNISHGPLRADIALQEGKVLAKVGRYEASDAKLREALRISAEFEQKRTVQEAAIRLMSLVGAKKKQTSQAKRYLDLAMGLSKGDPLSRADVYSSIGSILIHDGEYREGEKAHRQALSLNLETLGESNFYTMVSRHNLAESLRLQGRYVESKEEHMKVLGWRAQRLGDSHPSVATSHNSIGVICMAQGQHKAAARHYRLALSAFVDAFGGEHPNALISLNNLAGVQRTLGHYKDSEQGYRQALKIGAQILSLDHPDMAKFHSGLGSTLRAQGRYLEAASEFQRALLIFERVDDANPLHVAKARLNYGLALTTAGEYRQAEKEQERALAAIEMVHGTGHPDVAIARIGLAYSLKKQGRYREAEEQYLVALAIREESFGVEHPGIADLHSDLAELHRAQGHLDEAEKEHRHALRLREKMLATNHPDTARSHTLLAVTLIEQRQFDKAQPFAEEAWERLKGEDVPGNRRADSAFVLAQALWPNRMQRPRAWELAEIARDAYASFGDVHAEDLAEVKKWMNIRAGR